MSGLTKNSGCVQVSRLAIEQIQLFLNNNRQSNNLGEVIAKCEQFVRERDGVVSVRERFPTGYWKMRETAVVNGVQIIKEKIE